MFCLFETTIQGTNFKYYVIEIGSSSGNTSKTKPTMLMFGVSGDSYSGIVMRAVVVKYCATQSSPEQLCIGCCGNAIWS